MLKSLSDNCDNDGRLLLVIVHGLTCSLEDFYEFGWANDFGDDYGLILVDVRGHGHSDKPLDAEA